MHIRVGGFDATLRPARVYAKPLSDSLRPTRHGHAQPGARSPS
jgi:hypothetical protein